MSATRSSDIPSPRSGPARGRSLARFIAIALVVHLEVLALLALAFYFLAPRDADLKAQLASENNEPVDLKLVDDDAAREILADLEKREEERKAEEVRKEVEATKPTGQVVDIPKPLIEQRPDEAKHAAEYDATVSKEMKKHGSFDEKAQQGATSGDEQGSNVAASPGRASPPSSSSASRSSARPTVLALRDLPRAERGPSGVSPSATPAPSPTSPSPDQLPEEAPSPEGFAPLPPAGRAGAARAIPQNAGAASPASPAASLMPSSGQLARAVGSGTMDYLPDVDDGEDTALNAKKWRFASFFNRVKKQVQEQWHPAEVYRRRDPTGAIYGHINRLTIVQVKLKPDGFLSKVFLQQPSGLDFLDDEALEAFKMAQPFPNPPKQLVEADGLIHFSFGFLFEVSDTPRMMLFKYNM